MNEPRTAAGREMHGGHCRNPQTCDYLAAILAIEAEAAALDVNRLARAICRSRPPEASDEWTASFVDDECRMLAARVAAAYSAATDRVGTEGPG